MSGLEACGGMNGGHIERMLHMKIMFGDQWGPFPHLSNELLIPGTGSDQGRLLGRWIYNIYRPRCIRSSYHSHDPPRYP